MGNQKLYGESSDEHIVERVVCDDIHFELQPRNVALLIMALKVAIEKADMYIIEMKNIHDYIIQTALEQQKEKDF